MSTRHPDVSSDADLQALQQREPLPPLPQKRGEPVFRDSWEAEAYAIGNLLVKDGRLSRAEWMELMATAIRSAQAAGDPDCGDTYYQHWCAALEAFCQQKGWVSADDYQQLLALWARAIANTPHGVPLALENALASDSHHGHDPHDHDHHHGHDHHHHPPAAGSEPPEHYWTPIQRQRLKPPRQP